MNTLVTSHKERSNKILTLKKEFDNIKIFNNEVIAIFDNLDTKINKLKDIYKTFLNENQNTLFIFGLDAFKFQNRLIDEEYVSLKKYFDLICNRVYCDYYKLYNIIVDYILKDQTLEKIHKSAIKDKYEKYNYLDVYKHYSIVASADIFNDIVNLITLLSDESKSITNLIKSYNNKKRYGLNLNNFIYTHAYKNSILNEEMNLYINYLAFFLRLHMKYFRRFIKKIQLMYSEINSDINFDTEGNRRHTGGRHTIRVSSTLSSSIGSPMFTENVSEYERSSDSNSDGNSDGSSDDKHILSSPLSSNDIRMNSFMNIQDNDDVEHNVSMLVEEDDIDENSTTPEVEIGEIKEMPKPLPINVLDEDITNNFSTIQETNVERDGDGDGDDGDDNNNDTDNENRDGNENGVKKGKKRGKRGKKRKN